MNLCFVGYSTAGSSDELNDNPDVKLFPDFGGNLLYAKFESDDLEFQIKILKLLRDGYKDKAIQMLEAELLKKGNDLKSYMKKATAESKFEKGQKDKIDAIISDFDEYRNKYLR
jgi:hypothetical protein